MNDWGKISAVLVNPCGFHKLFVEVTAFVNYY